MAFFNRNQGPVPGQHPEPGQIPSVTAVPALVDTSVIIDGRIVDIAKAGFAPGKLLVPRFVLAELQLISDSGDAMKRGRGRRGLEMLHHMREVGIDLDIIEEDYNDIKEVDAKLVRLGRQMNCNVLTTDYNLNRVASIEGVRVLNINELANAVRPVVIPGERMTIKMVQPGKEKNQGVGYLADGTMIVVDGGDKLMGQEIEVEITRVFQTVAGKMLFAALTRPLSSYTHTPVSAAQANPRAKGNLNRNQGHSGGSRRNPRQERPEAPKTPQDGAPQAPRPPKPAGGKPAAGKPAGSNPRRPKRVSPTQKLENSLMELTNGSTDDQA
jgi:rRNA-processing protein FCF1